MREHVMHLPSDPVALHLPGLGDAELLGRGRTFSLDQGELPPGPDEHPPREHPHNTDDTEHALQPVGRGGRPASVGASHNPRLASTPSTAWHRRPIDAIDEGERREPEAEQENPGVDDPGAELVRCHQPG